MMKKITGCGVVLLAGSCLLLYAGDKDFWKTKAFADWTEKEVDKLLKNSPWSKQIPLNTLATQRPRRGFDQDEGLPGAAGADETGAEGGSRRSARDILRSAESQVPGDGGVQSLVVCWYSRPVREALARRIQLTDPEASKERIQGLLNYRNADYFELIVMRWSPRMESGTRAEIMQRLQENTFLVKRNKERISLGGMRFPSDAGQPLVFQFPRLLNGKPSLALEDKEVDLVTKLARVTVRARFKLAEMAIEGKLEN